MYTRMVTEEELAGFRQHLRQEEKSRATVSKYMRDVRRFMLYLRGRPVGKEEVIAFKAHLLEEGLAATSVNSMLASVHSLLAYLGLPQCRTRILRLQRQTYSPEEKELSRAEYARLLAAAGSGSRLNLILQTICGTGIRVSELQYFTIEALRRGEVVIRCKGKTRTVLVPARLRKMLLDYAHRCGIRRGVLFITRNSRPIDRSNIWTAMKALCRKANVRPSKVFPHNLRKLFARSFYQQEKDIAKLADLLGHSSINTTRIYIMTTGSEHRRKLEKLGLILDDRQKNKPTT